MDETIAKREADRATVQEKLLFAGYLLSQPSLSTRDVKVVLLSLFGDGLSTVSYWASTMGQTAPMLVYNLYSMAAHPDIQGRVRQEVKIAMGKAKGRKTVKEGEGQMWTRRCWQGYPICVRV